MSKWKQLCLSFVEQLKSHSSVVFCLISISAPKTTTTGMIMDTRKKTTMRTNTDTKRKTTMLMIMDTKRRYAKRNYKTRSNDQGGT